MRHNIGTCSVGRAVDAQGDGARMIHGLDVVAVAHYADL
jgi:hypothetical protein